MTICLNRLVGKCAQTVFALPVLMIGLIIGFSFPQDVDASQAGQGRDYEQLNLAWTARVDGNVATDRGRKLIMGDDGYLYLSGLVSADNSYFDLFAIKYDPMGYEEWAVTYDGPGHFHDFGNELAVDADGNVFITGNSRDAAENPDFTTLKYDSDGTLQWINEYNGTGDQGDDAYAIGVDPDGHVIAAGMTHQGSSSYDYLTIKYELNGTVAWARQEVGYGGGYDRIHDLAIDSCGNIYVTGFLAFNGTDRDLYTIKYDTDGNTLWSDRLNGAANGNENASVVHPSHLFIDGEDNVYVSGRIQDTPGRYDLVTMKLNSAGSRQWVETYVDPGADSSNTRAMFVDDAGNVYVAGSVGGLQYPTSDDTLDLLVIKYNSSGTELWTAVYDGDAGLLDEATDIEVSDSGRVFVSGRTTNSNSVHDYLTIVYDSEGSVLSMAILPGGSKTWSGGFGIAVDANESIFVTGSTDFNSSDALTVAYCMECAMDRQCYADGDVHPSIDCLECDTSATTSDWTYTGASATSPGQWLNTSELSGENDIIGLYETSDGTILAGGFAAYKSSDLGVTWEATGVMSGAADVWSFLELEDGTLFAGTSPNGNVYKSTDGGDNWTNTGELSGAAQVNDLLLAADGTIYAATNPNGDVFKSTNGGDLWVNTCDLPGAIHVVDLMEATDGVIYAATAENGDVFRSSTGGDTWATTGDIPGAYWAYSMVESNGAVFVGVMTDTAKIYRSYGGGTTWEEIAEFSHEVDVMTLAATDDGTIYAGTAKTHGDVYVSTDNGETWLSTGDLPGVTWHRSMLITSSGHLFAGTYPNGDVFRYCTGCVVDGACYQHGDVNPDASCQTCDICHSTTEWLTDGCLIDGVCYTDGDDNPENPCEECNHSQSTSSWTYLGDGSYCDDELYCTVNDICGAGVCDGEARNCSDSVACTDDSCDETGDVCVNEVNDTNCDDGAWCNGAETCDAVNDCQAGTAPDCDDSVACTDDSCDETGDACVNEANDANCDDGAWCNGAETCDAVNDCQAGTAPDCSDNGIFCDGEESCDEDADECASSGDPCESGTEECNEEAEACDPLGDDDDDDDDDDCGV